MPAGQERTVSYQREEERYWTDYLRVALPVIGLLLLLGLFWFWANSLIGDDDNEEPTAISELITDPTPSPTVQQVVDISPTPGSNESADQTDGGQGAEPTETPTEEADQTDGQQTGDGQDDGTTDQQDGTDQTTEDDGTTDQSEASQDDGEFAIEETVVINAQGDGLRLRTDAEINETNILDELPEGRELVILDGPTEAEGYIWYQVEDQETGQTGWVADDGFLDPA